MQETNTENMEEQEIDLKELLYMLRVRWWIVALVFFMAVTASAYVSFLVLEPVYESRTSLFVGKEETNIGPVSLTDLNLGQSLVSDYREILRSRLVAREVIEKLDLDMSIRNIQSRINVNTVSDARMFSIGFESSDPQLATDIANALAVSLIDKAAEIIEIDSVQVIDHAEVPINPIKPNKTLNLAIAGVLGIMLGVFLVFLLEFLDHTIKSEKDVEKHLAIPLLGGIPLFVGDRRSGKDESKHAGERSRRNRRQSAPSKGAAGFTRTVVTMNDPKSPASEAYRALRTSIGYTSIDHEVKTVVITSPGTMEGKSTVSANLAVTMSQIGKKVLLLDADLRKPKVHINFDARNDVGLTDIIANAMPAEGVIQPIEKVPNLSIIASGPIPPSSSVILESRKMEELLKKLRDQFDLIIIDTPPVGHITDAAIVGRKADGVVLVTASGTTNIDMARHAMQSLEQVKANVLGAVLTNIDKTSSGAYYYRYYQYDQYYYAE